MIGLTIDYTDTDLVHFVIANGQSNLVFTTSKKDICCCYRNSSKCTWDIKRQIMPFIHLVSTTLPPITSILLWRHGVMTLDPATDPMSYQVRTHLCWFQMCFKSFLKTLFRSENGSVNVLLQSNFRFKYG